MFFYYRKFLGKVREMWAADSDKKTKIGWNSHVLWKDVCLNAAFDVCWYNFSHKGVKRSKMTLQYVRDGKSHVSVDKYGEICFS